MGAAEIGIAQVSTTKVRPTQIGIAIVDIPHNDVVIRGVVFPAQALVRIGGIAGAQRAGRKLRRLIEAGIEDGADLVCGRGDAVGITEDEPPAFDVGTAGSLNGYP